MKKEIGKPLPAPNKLRVGDVIAIPVNSSFAYARHYRGATLGILGIFSEKVLPLDKIKQYKVRFFVEYCEPTDTPEWIYLGKWFFDSEEESWGPPTYVQDVIDPSQFRILEKGVMRDASKNEVRGLNKHCLLFPDSIKQKIIDSFKLESEKKYTLHD